MKALYTCLLMAFAFTSFSQNFHLTVRDVFDFQPGDVFEYRHSQYREQLGSVEETVRWERRTYLSRSMSTNNDTLTYTLEVYSLSGRDTVTQSITHLDSGLFVYNPDIHPDSVIKHFGYTASNVHMVYDSTHFPVYNSRVVEGAAINTLYVSHYYWAAGLGVVVSSGGDSNEGSGMNLTYYQKGTETYGTSVKVGIDETAQNSSLVSAYPNPFSDELNIQGMDACAGCTYMLYSVTGSILQQGLLEASIATEVSPAGLYVLQINNAEGKAIAHQKLLRK